MDFNVSYTPGPTVLTNRRDAVHRVAGVRVSGLTWELVATADRHRIVHPHTALVTRPYREEREAPRQKS